MVNRHALLVAAATVLAIGATFAAPHTAPARAATTPAYDHVFVIVMENHAYGEIIGSPDAPYVNSLLSSSALASNYYAVTHPSLPNYLALTSASTYGIASDCTTCWISASNLGDTLEAAGSTWKAYEESMPSPCFVGDSYPYAQKHDPFIYYNDIRNNAARCQSHIVPFTQLSQDLQSTSTTPNFAFITPNMCNDMHDCLVSTGDQWLQQQVPAILGSPAFASQHSLLAITWDEDDSSAANQVATIFLGANVNAGSGSALSYDHYSLVRTIEAARGLPTLNGNDGGAAAMADMFRSVSTTPCTSVSASISPASPQLPGTPVTIGISSSGCPNPQYELWIAPPNGAWQLKAAYQSKTSFTWTNTGLAAGDYRLSLWARDASSPGTNGTAPDTYDAFDAFTYTLSAPAAPPPPPPPPAPPPPPPASACSAVSTSSVPVGTATVAGQVAVQASATGCANPQFEFWIRSPAGIWALARPYSSSSSLTWSTVGLPAGSYRFSVWGRDASSAGTGGTAPYTYDAFSAFQYTLTVASCTAVNVTVTPANGAVAGGTVNITATASGCPNPRYELWWLPPGGTWQLARGYAVAGTFLWSTGGAPLGSYRFSVWAVDASSTGVGGGTPPYTYDAFSAFQYSLS